MNTTVWYGAVMAVAGLVLMTNYGIKRLRDRKRAEQAFDFGWDNPIVLLGEGSFDQAQDCCVECPEPTPAPYRLAFAMSSLGTPIEQAFCEEHAEHAQSDEAEWWS